MNNRLFQLPLLPRHLHTIKPKDREPPRTSLRLGAGKRSPLWYALSLPQLSAGSQQDEEAELVLQHRRVRVAELLGNLSATVSIEPQDSFLFEVRSSLRYFGGIEKIRSHLRTLLKPQLQAWGLPVTFHQAASPTPAASLLLARAGYNLLIYRQDNLRSALGKLSIQSLSLSKDQRRQLHNSGLRVLRDVWRLPTPALAQRMGLDFVRQLDRCLGKVANPVKTWQGAPIFSTALEFEFPVENTRMLLHSVEDMLGTFGDFLRRRELATTHLQLVLLHEQQESTCLSLDLRQPTRLEAHLLLLLGTRINNLLLPAPVTGMQLQAKHFAPFVASNDALRGMASQGPGADEDIIPLLEQLQARLGDCSVRNIFSVDEHCPEHAGQHGIFSGKIKTGAVTASNVKARTNSRPCWLLPQPLALEQSGGRLYYRSSLSLLSGPERIETRWWAGQDIRRDYYVAHNRQGMRLWIFRERRGERHWFLHGIFD